FDELHSLCNFLSWLGHPVKQLSHRIAAFSGCVGGCKIRVEVNCLREKLQGLFSTFLCSMRIEHDPPKVEVVSLEAFSRLSLRPLQLGLLNFRSNRGNHAGCHATLQIENILKR